MRTILDDDKLRALTARVSELEAQSKLWDAVEQDHREVFANLFGKRTSQVELMRWVRKLKASLKEASK